MSSDKEPPGLEAIIERCGASSVAEPVEPLVDVLASLRRFHLSLELLEVVSKLSQIHDLSSLGSTIRD